MSATDDDYIAWFENLGMGDVGKVGGKNASLGEMVRNLKARGVRVPDGFATTAEAYRAFVEFNAIGPELRERLSAMKAGQASLHETGESIRALFLGADFPEPIAEAILAAYQSLGGGAGHDGISVAVRSSATAEDLPDASFAGQQETFLNVKGARALMDACRRCYASLFTDRAISYRETKGFDHLQIALSIGVQKMVRADKAGSGVMFTLDTETGFADVIVINAAWGLGENVVQGAVNPDKYLIFKPLLKDERLRPIIEKSLGAKEQKMIYVQGGSGRTTNVKTTRCEQAAFVLSDNEILQLARWAAVIEQHYGRPMDMEWAKDGETGELAIVQARPETVQSRVGSAPLKIYRLTQRAEPLVSGAAVGQAIAAGPACVIKSAADIDQFKPGSILVTEITDPDWVPIMKQAAGIITDHGGTTSHAAIVSRELGVPAIVGAHDASNILRDGQTVTLSCAEGDVGYVYDGALAFESSEVNLADLPKTRTQMMINVASPAAAFTWWRLPVQGVGLARMEFIINNIIKIHPMALVHPDRVDDIEARRQIRDLTRGYEDPKDYFVDTLAAGIAKIAAPYHPNPVIVRLSDFKTNEYAHLIGGAGFEPKEENPMLGWRGASRYYDERYREGFALECRAPRKVREVIGLANIVIMVPFCRTPEEADRVLAVLAEEGLRRGENGLEIYMMCEIPANVILAEEFARRFDGFSIGSNDLTQLILGVDRDSADLAPLFDERNEAVKRAIREAISKAHAAGIKIGICGQAPSNYPDFAAFLVEEGIDSISLNPDSFVATVRRVAEVEAGLAGA
jgi:pyruvate,water dikinase